MTTTVGMEFPRLDLHLSTPIPPYPSIAQIPPSLLRGRRSFNRRNYNFDLQIAETPGLIFHSYRSLNRRIDSSDIEFRDRIIFGIGTNFNQWTQPRAPPGTPDSTEMRIKVISIVAEDRISSPFNANECFFLFFHSLEKNRIR